MRLNILSSAWPWLYLKAERNNYPNINSYFFYSVSVYTKLCGYTHIQAYTERQKTLPIIYAASKTLNTVLSGEFGLIYTFYVRISTMTPIQVRSQNKVHTDERTQVHSVRSSLVVTHPSTNRGRRWMYREDETERRPVRVAWLATSCTVSLTPTM